jgi:predicted extracellular nuclease
MMRKIRIVLAFLFINIQLFAQQNTDYFVMFYNVENLFDTIDNPLTLDNDFLPDSPKQWNTQRYNDKLDKISRVISQAASPNFPFAVGLCEIENREVVEAITKSPHLKKIRYEIVHEESPDQRGIDVAFMYDKKVFTYLNHRKIEINFPDPKVKTRDILLVSGTMGTTDTLHFFVNHWPSRRGGAEVNSEQYRISAAAILKQAVDSISYFTSYSANHKVIIMGDFNDYPTNMSLIDILNATNNPKKEDLYELYNLTYDKHVLKDGGTYSYQGEWGYLDQLIISKNLLNAEQGLKTTPKSAYAFNADWLIYTNPKSGETSPSKTYGGNNYYGGYSDHLPIVGKFEWINTKPTNSKKRKK